MPAEDSLFTIGKESRFDPHAVADCVDDRVRGATAHNYDHSQFQPVQDASRRTRRCHSELKSNDAEDERDHGKNGRRQPDPRTGGESAALKMGEKGTFAL